MRNLENVTLICLDCYNYGMAVDAIKKSLKHIQPKRTIFLTDIEIELEGIEVIQIPTISSKKEYSEFMIKKLKDYFDTTHCLVIQHDGYVINGDAWDDEFLKYDYIGAPWLYPDDNVGNGGFSLRSLYLQRALAFDEFIVPTHPEDENIGRLYRSYLEKMHNIVFADESVAEKFSFELKKPVCKTFGFHGYFHKPYKPAVVIKRTGAMGDVVMAEPLLHYFYVQDYDVYLDTMPENMDIFFNHPYPIYHISQMHERTNPVKTINLDLSYELFPKMNVLESYFKFSGVELTKEFRRNSFLMVSQNADRWLFDNYVVFHIDDTDVPSRNVFGVDWENVQRWIEKSGYQVIQVGKRNNRNYIGTYFHTAQKQMLMYLLAGAEMVIGIDSGVTQLAVALNKKTIILTGSVDLKLRYQDFTNIKVIKNPCQSEENEYCYHNESLSVTGKDCVYDKNLPPCTRFKDWQIINAFQSIIETYES